MAQERKVYRSRAAVLGGVCAGMADHFDMDAIVVRILAVILTLLTCGLFSLAYAFAWVFFPLVPEADQPVNVIPLGIDATTVKVRSQEERSRISANPSFMRVGNKPPVPPPVVLRAAEERKRRGLPPFDCVPISAMPDGGANPGCATAPVNDGFAVSQGAYVDTLAQERREEEQFDSARFGMVIGGAIVLFLAMIVSGGLARDIEPWQFWPLGFVVASVVFLALPYREGDYAVRTAVAFSTFSLGALLLPITVNLYAPESVLFMIAGAWPTLLAMVLLVLFYAITKRPGFLLLYGVCSIAFVVVGFTFFGVPGLLDAVVVDIPLSREWVLYRVSL